MIIGRYSSSAGRPPIPMRKSPGDTLHRIVRVRDGPLFAEERQEAVLRLELDGSGPYLSAAWQQDRERR